MRSTRLPLEVFQGVLLLFLFIVYANGQSGVVPPIRDWRVYTSAADGFSTSFPRTPISKAEDQNYPDFKVVFRRYIDSSNRNYYFEVGHAEFPPIFRDKSQAYDLTAKLLSSIVAKFNKEATISQRDMRDGNCEGREVVVKFTGGAVVQVRVFMSGQHLYQLTTGSTINQANSERTVNHFLNSFRITNGCNDRIGAIAVPSSEIKESVLEGTLHSVTGWRQIISDQDGLEMLVPTSAKVVEQDVSNGMRLTSRSFYSHQGSATYFVNATGRFPSGFSKPNTAEIGLDILEQNLRTDLASINPRFTLIRKLKVGNFPGREFSFIADGRQGKAQLFITASHRYIILVTDRPDHYSTADVDRFLNSIRLSRD